MRRWLWVVVLLVLIVAGDAALWRFVTQRLQSGLNDWIAAQRTIGWHVATEGEQAGGWPFAATISMRNVALERSEPLLRGAVAWRSDHVALRVSILHPGTLQIDGSGAGQVQVAGGSGIPYAAQQLSVALPLWTAGPPGSARLAAADFRIGPPGQQVAIGHLAGRVAVRPAAGAAEAAVSIALDASEIGLPRGPDWALGPHIASLAADVALDGPLPTRGMLAEQAITWRDDGGALDVRKLQVVWGPLHLRASAKLRLDQDLQPSGDGSATVSGYAAAADAFAAHGVMPQGAAVAAKALLSLMAQSPADGGPSEVNVPLSLQHSTLAMRQVPLARIPALDWPRQ